MTDRSPALSRDPVTKRAVELDALAAILPMDRRDRLAEILTASASGAGQGRGVPVAASTQASR